jgi:hypothetical protein
MPFDALPRAAKDAYRAAKRRALNRKMEMMSEGEFVELWTRSGEHCAISGLRFSDEPEEYKAATGYVRLTSRPWEPSLDQVEAGLGYSFENSQLVCKCVNIGKSGYSTETFERWVVAAARRIDLKRRT